MPTFTFAAPFGEILKPNQYFASRATAAVYLTSIGNLQNACLNDGSLRFVGSDYEVSPNHCTGGDPVLLVEQTCLQKEPQLSDVYISHGSGSSIAFGDLMYQVDRFDDCFDDSLPILKVDSVDTLSNAYAITADLTDTTLTLYEA